MRNGFRGLRLRKAVIHRPVEMVGNLRDLTGRDERADRDQAPIARRKVRTQPQVPEQNIGGVLDDSRDHPAELLLNARRPVIIVGS